MKKNKFITVFILLFLNRNAMSLTYKQLEHEVLSKNTLIKEKEQELIETELQIKKINADLYPHLSAIIGQEKLIAPNEGQTENSKTVTEVRLDYKIYQFGVTKKKLKALEQTKKIRTRNLIFVKDQLKRDLKKLYFSTLAIKKNLDLINDEIKYNKTLKSQVSRKKSQGLVGNADILEIEMREATLINTQIKLTEEYQHGLDLIRKLSYITHDEKLSLSGDIPHDHFEMNFDNIIKAAKRNNVDLMNIDTQLISLQNEIDVSFAKRLPSIKLMGRFGNMRIDETYTANDSPEGLVGLYLKIPIFDGGKKSAEQKIKKSRYERSRQEMIKTKHHLEIDLAHKFEKFQNIHRLLDLSEKNSIHAKKYFKNVLDEYKRGVKNSLDLVSARDRLYQFQIDVINYKKQYQLSKLEIEKMTLLTLEEKR